MNHNVTVNSLNKHITAAKNLAAVDSKLHVIGECNSGSGGGAAGLSDTSSARHSLGDGLHRCSAASSGVIQRVHYHRKYRLSRN